MTYEFTNKIITILKDQLQTEGISQSLKVLTQNEINRLELALQVFN